MVIQSIHPAIAQNARSGLPVRFASLALCAALQGQPERAMRWLGVMDRALVTIQIILLGAEAVEYDKSWNWRGNTPRERNWTRGARQEAR